jgi:hypothetical protein
MGKNIRIYDQLSNKITADFAWRRKELKIIKDQIPIKKNPLQNAALRFSIPILYAHWEGFTKISCEYYLQYIAAQHIEHKFLKPQFIALSLSKKIGKLEVKSIRERTRSIELLIELLPSKSNIQTKNVIQTKSNLRYSVFEEVLFILDLNDSLFKRYKSLIDDLVDIRNTIAHGNNLRVDYATYMTMHDDIQALMGILKNEIENTAVLQLYRVNASV